MAGKSERVDALRQGFEIDLFDSGGERYQKKIKIPAPRRFKTQDELEEALTAAGVPDQYFDGDFGTYKFRYVPSGTWHSSFRDARDAAANCVFATPPNLQVALFHDDVSMLQFQWDDPKDDIASALQLFKGDVAAAAEYLKGRQ
jgi:hypothetical protein